jgi:hypothetical protein
MAVEFMQAACGAGEACLHFAQSVLQVKYRSLYAKRAMIGGAWSWRALTTHKAFNLGLEIGQCRPD